MVSKCNGGEVECKKGFEEPHSVRGRSKKLRSTDSGVGKVNLPVVGEGQLYTLGTLDPGGPLRSGPLQRNVFIGLSVEPL
jgi:hypothetical protein